MYYPGFSIKQHFNATIISSNLPNIERNVSKQQSLATSEMHASLPKSPWKTVCEITAKWSAVLHTC